ncbi:MAG: PAS domain-containing protein, partial [Desulfatitalea sp.]|nr:PAS domain-containing protein [Desulfatitalea sp.]
MPDKTVTSEARFKRWAAVAALLAAGTGGAALLGLLAGLPRLASLGSGYIPMAPSTALLLLLYGVTIFLHVRQPGHSRLRRAGLVIFGAGTLASLVLGLLALNRTYLTFEHLGMTLIGSVAGVPVGHMSPLTALCFLLAGLSGIGSLALGHGHGPCKRLAGWPALLLAMVSSVLLLAYLYGAPLLYHSGFVPPAATTSIAFFLLSAALLAQARPATRTYTPLSAAFAHTRNGLIAAVLILAMVIISTGYLYFRKHIADHRQEMASHLSAVAELKVAELVRWRSERLGDGSMYFRNPDFSVLVRLFLDRGGQDAPDRRVATWLEKVRDAYGYDRVFFVDRVGTLRYSVPDSDEPPGHFLLDQLATLLSADAVQLSGLHPLYPGGPVRMAVAVPVADPDPAAPPLGLLVLRIDPEAYLFPFLRRWPTPSRTAETLLVRREGDKVMFLNPLRFADGAPLDLHVNVSGAVALPAIKATQGMQGVVLGPDYRGVAVVAAVRSVADTPWFLVARMDQAEVDAPLRKLLWVTIALVCALVLAVGAGAGLIWRRQRARFYRQQMETAQRLRELSLRQEAILAAVPDIVIETDGDQVCTWANGPGVAFFGADLIGRSVDFHWGASVDGDDGLNPKRQAEVRVSEGLYRRSDGQERLLAWRSRRLA